MTGEKRRETTRYVIGAGLSAALTLLAFWAVMGGVLGATATGWTIGAAAVAQVIVQLRFFLHIGWRSRREDLQLILFSLLLMALMIGGTLWIMGRLATRM